MKTEDTNSAILQTAKAARDAAAKLSNVGTQMKNDLLIHLAARLEAGREQVLAANAVDMEASRKAGLTQAKLRRLEITPKGIDQMVEGLRQIAALPDPVGQVTKDYHAPSGLHVRKVRAPLGVVAMIYEARPNVTIDAFSLCFKAGNACLLKGGREAAASNEALGQLAQSALGELGLPESCIAVLTASSRDDIRTLLTLDRYIDLVIPRGGEELIRFVHQHSRIPTVQHFQGVCHIFVDDSATLPAAFEICAKAKTSGPATCNAVEAILVHERIAATFIPQMVEKYSQLGVEVRGDETVCKLASAARPASASDWGKEYLDLIVAMKVVTGIEQAIDHIHRYGTNHTEAILSENSAHQQKFLDEVQASCTLVNASTRFNDGFQLGLGAEIGISTSKIHAYGPMGLEELTTQRYVVRGTGQAR